MKKVKVRVIKVKNASFDINFQMKIADILSSSNKVEKACGIGSKSRVYRCNNKTCKFNYDFKSSDKALCSVAKITYD